MRPVVVVLVLGACGRGGFEQRLQDAPGDGAPEDTAEPQIDAASDDAANDAPILAGCGTTTLIDDLFDDSAALPAFSANPSNGLTLVEASGRVDVQFAASVSSGSYAFYRSAASHPAEGLCAVVEVSQVPSGAGAAYFKLRTAQLEVEFFAANGMLEMRTRQSGAAVVRSTIPVDLVTDRFWRFRQQAGTTFWETSSNGTTYTTRTSVAAFFTVMNCQVELGAGAPVTVTNAGAARYERALVTGP